MAFYELKKEDGTVVVRQFPIGTCPAEITDSDGRVAKRKFTAPGISWKPGQESEHEKMRMKEARTRDNIAAGDRGRKEWRERMPKLKLE